MILPNGHRRGKPQIGFDIMPEIAEVKKFVTQLSAQYQGQDLSSIKVVGGRFVKEGFSMPFPSWSIKYPLKNVKFHSKGKFIYWEFDDNIFFFITLGMSGSFGKQNKHSAIEFEFSNGKLYFNDIRHFGTFKIVTNRSELNKKLAGLGWDPFLEPQIPSNLIPKLRKKNFEPIGKLLMDQKLFAGLGNYLRSEILYASQINPFTRTIDLSDEDLLTVARNYRTIAEDAYQHGGATLATYSDMYGIAGTFYQQFKVYGKKRDPLGNEVISQDGPDGRTVHWVPQVQKITNKLTIHSSISPKV